MLTTTKLTLGRYELPLGMPLYLYFVVLVMLALTYLPLFFSEPIVDAFAREDRIFESLSAVYLFFAAAAFASVTTATKPTSATEPTATAVSSSPYTNFSSSAHTAKSTTDTFAAASLTATLD